MNQRPARPEVPAPNDSTMSHNSSPIFEHTRLPGARFADVDLAGSKFNDVSFRQAVFQDVALTGASFSNACFGSVSIADANLEGMTIDGILVSELLRVYAQSIDQGKPVP